METLANVWQVTRAVGGIFWDILGDLSSGHQLTALLAVVAVVGWFVGVTAYIKGVVA